MKPARSLEDALQRICAQVQPLGETECIGVSELGGRILAKPVYALAALPAEDQSAMDGYAFRERDTLLDQACSMPIHATSWAGRPYTGHVPPGSCVRIMTGAAMPRDTDTVIIQEHVDVNEASISFTKAVEAGSNVRRAGEDVQSGDLLLDAGTRIETEHLGLLIAAGLDRVEVIRKLRISCFSTGDELRAPGEILQAGQLFDSNRIVMNQAILQSQSASLHSACLPDDPAAIETALLAAAEHSDLIVTSGGASVGEADHLASVIAKLGSVDFWKVPIKPGKPVLFGRISSSWIIALPGNPVSAWVTFYLLVRPLLRHLAGGTAIRTPRLSARLTAPMHKNPGRAEYQRGVYHCTDSGLDVCSAGPQGSHRLSVLARANCLIEMSAECGSLEAGCLVSLLPFTLLR